MGTGSMRLRGRDSWQLRVYLGTDPGTGRPRWLSKTVHGTERFARRQLEDLVAEAGRARIRAGTVGELLDQWFDAASPGWSASTVSHTRSIVECHLRPHLGHLDLAKLTTADIDDFYAHLLRAGGRNDRPPAPGTVARVHGVLHRALAQAVRWDWIWLNPASNATPPRVSPAEVGPSAVSGTGGHAPRPGEERGSAAVLLPEARRLDRCPSQSASGPSVGGRR
jgi:integrase